MDIEDLRITMTFSNSDNHVLTVEYNPYSWTHSCFDEDGYLGEIPLRELFFAKYECIGKTFNF